jgi:hypothetical protein
MTDKIDLTSERIAELLKLDPNIGSLIEMAEDLPRGSAHYFYMRNLLASYIKALGDRQQLRQGIANVYEWTAVVDGGFWIEENIDRALEKAGLDPNEWIK